MTKSLRQRKPVDYSGAEAARTPGWLKLSKKPADENDPPPGSEIDDDEQLQPAKSGKHDKKSAKPSSQATKPGADKHTDVAAPDGHEHGSQKQKRQSKSAPLQHLPESMAAQANAPQRKSTCGIKNAAVNIPAGNSAGARALPEKKRKQVSAPPAVEINSAPELKKARHSAPAAVEADKKSVGKKSLDQEHSKGSKVGKLPAAPPEPKEPSTKEDRAARGSGGGGKAKAASSLAAEEAQPVDGDATQLAAKGKKKQMEQAAVVAPIEPDVSAQGGRAARRAAGGKQSNAVADVETRGVPAADSIPPAAGPQQPAPREAVQGGPSADNAPVPGQGTGKQRGLGGGSIPAEEPSGGDAAVALAGFSHLFQQADSQLIEQLLAPATASANPKAFAMLQDQYIQLQGLYQQLKNQKIQDLEGLLNEQDEYVDELSASVQKLADHWRAEAEKQAELGRKAGSPEFVAKAEQLQEENVALRQRLAAFEEEGVQLRKEVAERDARAAASAAHVLAFRAQLTVQLHEAHAAAAAASEERDVLRAELEALLPAPQVVCEDAAGAALGQQTPAAPPGLRNMSLQFPTPPAPPVPSPGIATQFPSPFVINSQLPEKAATPASTCEDILLEQPAAPTSAVQDTLPEQPAARTSAVEDAPLEQPAAPTSSAEEGLPQQSADATPAVEGALPEHSAPPTSAVETGVISQARLPMPRPSTGPALRPAAALFLGLGMPPASAALKQATAPIYSPINSQLGVNAKVSSSKAAPAGADDCLGSPVEGLCHEESQGLQAATHLIPMDPPKALATEAFSMPAAPHPLPRESPVPRTAQAALLPLPSFPSVMVDSASAHKAPAALQQWAAAAAAAAAADTPSGSLRPPGAAPVLSEDTNGASLQPARLDVLMSAVKSAVKPAALQRSGAGSGLSAGMAQLVASAEAAAGALGEQAASRSSLSAAVSGGRAPAAAIVATAATSASVYDGDSAQEQSIQLSSNVVPATRAPMAMYCSPASASAAPPALAATPAGQQMQHSLRKVQDGQLLQVEREAGSKTLSTPGLTPRTAKLVGAVVNFFGFKVLAMKEEGSYEYIHPQSGLRFQLGPLQIEDSELAAAEGDDSSCSEEEGGQGATSVTVLHYRPVCLGKAKLPHYLQEEIMVPLSSKQAFVNQVWTAVNAAACKASAAGHARHHLALL